MMTFHIKRLLSKVSWFRLLFYSIHGALPDEVFCFSVNLLHRCSLVKVSVCCGPDGDYVYADNGSFRYASDRLRGLRLWYRGFKFRDAQLAEKYGLAIAHLDDGETVIDCGANYGDVYFALMSLGKRVKYLAIEPDPSVQGVLTKNIAPNGCLYRLAFGERDDESVRFFLSGMSGDSSVVRPGIVEKEIVVSMKTLVTFVEDARLQQVGLLKLEAEGYEIEILRGASKVLDRFKYVAVDGSAERGGLETLGDLQTMLERCGFDLINHSARYVSALFKKSASHVV